MTAGSKRVACTRLPAEELIYSEDPSERGSKCGEKIQAFLGSPREDREADYAACKIEAFVWLGRAEQIGACWSAIPPGYDVDHERSADVFPKYVEYTRSSVRRTTFLKFSGQGRATLSCFN